VESRKMGLGVATLKNVTPLAGSSLITSGFIQGQKSGARSPNGSLPLIGRSLAVLAMNSCSNRLAPVETVFAANAKGKKDGLLSGKHQWLIAFATD